METATAAGKKWFVITTYSGFENKVKSALQERIRQYRMEDKFGEILIPSETVSDTTKDGKQRVKGRGCGGNTATPCGSGIRTEEQAMSPDPTQPVKKATNATSRGTADAVGTGRAPPSPVD